MMKFLKGVAKEFSPTFNKWDEPSVRDFNGLTVEGRPTRGFGDAPFKYAGKSMQPEPWTKQMKGIKHYAERIASTHFDREVIFTFCLCGRYETGQISIPHHSDTVPTQKDIVFSLSFGCPRVFEWTKYHYAIKKKTDTSKTHINRGKSYAMTTTYLLEHGDGLLFDGEAQMYSTHAVPPITGVGERINLTFRSGL